MPEDNAVPEILSPNQIIRNLCNRRRNSDIRADDKELRELLESAFQRLTEERDAAQRETRISFEQYQVFTQIENQRDQYASEVSALRAELEADPRMKMYTWGHGTRWLAVARARTSERARRLLLGFDRIGESGDGSCPVRDQAREFVTKNQPAMWIGENAEFCLSDSSELEEQENHSRQLEEQVSALRVKLEAAELDTKRLDWWLQNHYNGECSGFWDRSEIDAAMQPATSTQAGNEEPK